MTARTGDRRRGPLWLLAAALGIGGTASAQPPEPLRVLTQVRPSTCYVGQAVDLVVGVGAQDEVPGVTPPRLEDAELSLVRTDMVPLSVSSIGDLQTGENLYRFRYRLVPRRAGVLTVPPFNVRLGDRQGAGRPVKLEARATPAEGRPSAFLGGVGPFELRATAEPPSVRTGQAFEYRIAVTGPGAFGSRGAPDVNRLARLPLGLDVERLPDLESVEPPSHTFVYRLRPTRPGEAVLPPVSVAALDPSTGRYVTKVTPGVPVRVSEVARFDPGLLTYGPAETATGRATAWAWAAAGGVALGLTAAWAARAVARRQGDPGRRVARLAAGLASRLERTADPAERGRVLTEGLVEYLRLTNGRPAGALTPDEAGAGVAAATGRDDLAGEAARLVGLSDAARFGPASASDGLAAAGASLFRSLAGSRPAGGGVAPS